MAKKKTVNWEKIKIEYVTTNISQRDLAKKHKIPYATVRDRSKTEGWYVEKKQYRSKVVADAKNIIAKKNTDILVREYDIACQFVKLIEQSVKNDDYITPDGLLNTKTVLQAAKALAAFMDIKRICKGHQTIQEQQAHDIALRKIELEEKKVNREDNSDNEIIVTLSDDVKEWIV